MRHLAWIMTFLWLVPLGLVAFRSRTRVIDAGWWWMAVGFAVSFVADGAGGMGYERLASQVYPAVQGAVFVLVLLDDTRPRLATLLICALFAVSGASVAWRAGQGVDLLLHLIAWPMIAVLASKVLSRSLLRDSLLGFGVLPMAYLAQRLAPSYWTWAMMRVVVVAMLWTWCAAAWQGTQRRRDEQA